MPLVRRNPRAYLFLGAVVLAACTSKSAPSYTVRAKVEKLEHVETPTGLLHLNHEPLPTFRDREGKVVGMGQMTMPFGYAPGVAVGDLVVGDLVEITFDVNWGRQPTMRVNKLRKVGP